MNTSHIVLTIIAAILWLAPTAQTWAHEGMDHDQDASDQATEKASNSAEAPIEVGNKICTVSKEKIGEMGEAVQYEYEGKLYSFCCPECIKDFKKDPEKYIKNVLEEMHKNDPSTK